MKTIIVASKNPVKIKAAERALITSFPNEKFEVIGFSAESGVPDQPMSDTETLQGALNRITHAKQENPEADIWVSMEGGLEDTSRGMECMAWIAIEDKDGCKGKARTACFLVPEKIAELVRGGMELGHADDKFFGRENSKQANGLVGLLTNDIITRADYYHQALVLASIPLKKKDLY